MMCEHHTFASVISGCGKAYYFKSTIITYFIVVVGLKMSSLTTMTLESANKMLLWFVWNLSNTHSSQKLSLTLSVVSSFGS
jgi:hypothetical protein